MDRIKIFEIWKKEFLQLEELKYFNVYLTGSFNSLYNNIYDGIDLTKKYTEEDIHNMTNKEIVMLWKCKKSQYSDIDIVCTTQNYDSNKIKKLYKEAIDINKKYYHESIEGVIYFDLMYLTQSNFVNE